ncbi:vam6 Vps39 isoform X2 [Brachionus plicatilis]|uniref:Vam6 Vps39 isoform X2 n=1 Tax=Brachionus plicatilis TaxID=10195 RepID=A0A3M7PL82_BRAPC|nr:vam6 Vps39 isoform X2 [Brachionus plicatilis]
MTSKNTNAALMLHPAANQTHKAFEVYNFAEKIPLVIECMACYDNIFMVGTYSGQILIYEINQVLEPVFDKSIKITKKPIQQIEVVKEFNIVLVLFDYQIHVIDLEKYQLQYSITKSKNCSLFSTSVSKDKKLLRLVVACKRKIQFYYLSNQINSKFMELISDLELNDVPRTLEITSENLVIFSLKKDFFYYELPSTSAGLGTSSELPAQKLNSGSRSIDPLCYKLHNDNFLIAFDENKSVLFDAKGAPILSYPIEWSGCPSFICNIGFYLIAIIPNTNTVEILTMEPSSTSVQLIEFNKESSSTISSSLGSSFTSKIVDFGLGGLGSAAASAPEKLKILKSNKKSVCYVANQSSVWCLSPVNINDQINSAILLKNFDLGLALMSAQSLFNQVTINEIQEDKHLLVQPFYSLSFLQQKMDENLSRKLRNMHALSLFVQKKFVDSFQLFQKMKTDPSHLIAFFPGLLPDGYRARLNLDDYYQSFEPKELEDGVAGLIDYLQFKRNEFLKTDDLALSLEPLIDGRPVIRKKISLLEIIDTTLLKCYLISKESLVQFFLRRDPNFLHLEESERLLNQHNKTNELIILYEKKEAHEKALNLLLTESSKSNSSLSGLKHLVNYMKKIGTKNLALVFKYGKSVIETDYHWGLKIFIGGNFDKLDNLLEEKARQKDENVKETRSLLADSDMVGDTLLSTFLKIDLSESKNKKKNQDSLNLDLSTLIDDDDEFLKDLNHAEVVAFLDEQIEPRELSAYLVKVYLQYCVYVWKDREARINNKLVDIYQAFVDHNYALPGQSVDAEKPKSYKQVLKFLLNYTNNYEPLSTLAKLDLDKYPEERAIVLGKMGHHKDALSIYVNILNDTQKAEAYCEYIYSQSYIAGSKDVFYELLQLYLNSDYEEIRIDASIRLLNMHSKEIGTVKTLELLPAQLMKCKNLSQFFENMLDRIVRTKHDTQIRNRLMVALQLQVHENKIMCQDKKFVVTHEQICHECNKRMGRSAMVRYPNGVLIHYGCLKNSETILKTSNT